MSFRGEEWLSLVEIKRLLDQLIFYLVYFCIFIAYFEEGECLVVTNSVNQALLDVVVRVIRLDVMANMYSGK